MRIIVIGAVAAGTSAAAKARRNDENAQIVVYEKDRHISYSGCGMPYYISGEVEEAEELYPRDAGYFKKKYNVDIRPRHEVMAIHPKDKTLRVKNLNTGEEFTDHYDRLVIATGAYAVTPPIAGKDQPHVFTLRTVGDMLQIHDFIEAHKPKTAAIIGSGFIGLEMCESLRGLGLEVTLIEKLPQVIPALDPDMAVHVQKHLEEKGVKVFTGATATQITEKEVLLDEGSRMPADLVLVSTGVKPNVALAKEAGIALGETGAIHVDDAMRTSQPDIYACGDCIETPHILTGKPVWLPLGSTANKTGRIAGDAVTGGDLRFRGVMGTGIFRVFDLGVAQTGLSEREARGVGFDVAVSHASKLSRPGYMGGKELTIKAVADKVTGKLLGAQIVGYEGVDKRIDVFVTALTYGAMAEDLSHLDLAYAPPFSTTRDPVMYAGMILDGVISRGRPLMTAEELEERRKQGEKIQVIDAREKKSFEKRCVEGAVCIPQEELRQQCENLDKEAITLTYCNRGTTGNAAQNILIGKGFKRVYNLSGGEKQYHAVKRLKQ